MHVFTRRRFQEISRPQQLAEAHGRLFDSVMSEFDSVMSDSSMAVCGRVCMCVCPNEDGKSVSISVQFCLRSMSTNFILFATKANKTLGSIEENLIFNMI